MLELFALSFINNKTVAASRAKYRIINPDKREKDSDTTVFILNFSSKPFTSGRDNINHYFSDEISAELSDRGIRRNDGSQKWTLSRVRKKLYREGESARGRMRRLSFFTKIVTYRNRRA